MRLTQVQGPKRQWPPGYCLWDPRPQIGAALGDEGASGPAGTWDGRLLDTGPTTRGCDALWIPHSLLSCLHHSTGDISAAPEQRLEPSRHFTAVSWPVVSHLLGLWGAGCGCLGPRQPARTPQLCSLPGAL